MSVLLVQLDGTHENSVNVNNVIYKGEAVQAKTLGTVWGTVDYIILDIGVWNNPGNAVLKVYDTAYATKADIPIGAVTLGVEVGSVSLDTSEWVHGSRVDRTFTFDTPINVSDGVYFITLQCPTADETNYLRWRYGNTVSNPGRLQSVDGGLSWTNGQSSVQYDTKVYGTYATPTKATTPAPANAAGDVTLDQATLTWVDGGGATSYNVYYGDTSGALTLVSEGQAGLSLTVTGITLGSPYAYAVTRYWRIDSVNAAGTTTGDEWSFTTINFDQLRISYVLITGGSGAGPYDTPPGVEGTDWRYTGENNMATIRRLVAAANNKIWIEEI